MPTFLFIVPLGSHWCYLLCRLKVLAIMQLYRYDGIRLLLIGGQLVDREES